MQMKFLKPREKENFVDVHRQTTDMFDICAKIRNILRGTTENTSLKRRSEEQPDISHITKYRRVSNDFPKIITKPFEDDIRFIHPVMSNKRSVVINDKKSSLNKYYSIAQQQQHQQQQQQQQLNNQPQSQKYKVNRQSANYAYNEYSDDDDDVIEQINLTKPLASSSFNTSNYNKNNIQKSIKYQLNDNQNNNKLNTTQYVVNIPIKLLDNNNKKPIPPLIEAKTGNIFGNSSIPNLKPIKRNSYNIFNQQNNNDINYNGYINNNNDYNNLYINNGIAGNTINKIEQKYQQQQQHQPKQTTDISASTSSAFPWSNFNKQQNYKNLANSYLIGNTNSIVSQVFNVQKRNSYADLLKKVAPTIYNSCEKLSSSSASSSATQMKPISRRSIHSNCAGMSSQKLTNNDNLYDSVDLTANEHSSRKDKSTNIINLDEDDELNIIDLDDDEVQIIKAYNKMNKMELREQKKQQQLDKKKELPVVEAVNSLKERHVLSPVYEPQWLENFKLKCLEKHRIQNQKIIEAKEEARQQTEETERQERIIEKKLKNFIISSETIVLVDESDDEEEIEFPEFTDSEHEDVKRAIYRGSSDEVLITKFNMNITRRDIQTLTGDNWLNDEVINFYMNLLMERGEKRSNDGYPKVYAMNTFFIPRLMSSGHSGVRRWTRKVDIFNYDVIPVPVHVGGVHWCMAIIHLKNKTIKYYDSMGTPNLRVLIALEQYLKDECLDKKKMDFDTSGFVKEFVPDCPRQMNGSDCGVFSCMFAEYISRNRNITFSQQHMSYFRHKMVLEIVKGKLLL